MPEVIAKPHIAYFVKSLMNTCPKDCLRCPGLARQLLEFSVGRNHDVMAAK